ncbi:MAG: DUF6298 domain-containing protein [Chitinophagaceae bacterium]
MNILLSNNFFCKKGLKKILFFAGLIFFTTSLFAQKNNTAKPLPELSFFKGKLIYAIDGKGNRIPDFSWCGYQSGEQPIPLATTGIIVPLVQGDATLTIQSAIDYVSKLPVGKNGLRGAVFLQAGTYTVAGQLHLYTSGVIIQGAGSGDNGTILLGAGKNRTTLITIAGKNDKTTGTSFPVTDAYVPVNANSIHVDAANQFKKGDNIIITRPSIKEWIDLLGTDHFGGDITSLGWKPGQRDIFWNRTITAVDGNTISFDAPLTTAIEKDFGGATIAAYSWPGRITNCGIENCQMVSSYDTNNEKDEAHRWMAITIDNTKDSWVRQVIFKYFAGSAVAVYENASRITVEDCISQHPVSEMGGERRNTFFTAGQQTLFQRCYAEYGMHDFATGFCAPGPNAFVQCESHQPYSFCGGIDSWSAGVLFDVMNVDGQAMSFMNRGQDGQGAGWNNANSLFWNCSAARIDCYRPPGAQNWAFGAWSQFAGDGYWTESNNSIEPRSLYYQQLKERIGAAAVNNRVQVMDIGTEASSSPTVEQAAALIKLAVAPAQTLLDFINESKKHQPFNVDLSTIKKLSDVDIIKPKPVVSAPVLEIKNGWLVRGNRVMTGNRSSVPWWSGSARTYALKTSQNAITRFVPGRTGKGLTDDLDDLTDSMLKQNVVGMEQNYGLWYDRRRDDHERIRRMDGDVWTPFYELPFARSGQGTAWDGLSKYDLTKYNTFYWGRLKEFADLADKKGLVLINQDYFQHNIIEAGAHYADFPWRPANNINNTGFPEPPPYAGDKRIFLAEQFYDETNPLRRELHRKYIRQCLDNFSGNNGVIQLIGEEFTGPLHFVQFWTDVIKDWEKENNKKPLIALAVTKDVQDSLLADSARAAVIDIIDIRYWHYQADGSAYAPRGGQSLAPRQHARLLKPKSSSFEQVYRAVSEYRQRYPGKAVMYSGDGVNLGWAVFIAGGSLPLIPSMPQNFLTSASSMQPVSAGNNKYALSNSNKEYIIYINNNDAIQVDMTGAKGNYKATWFDAKNGSVKKEEKIRAGKNISLTPPAGGSSILWISR